MVVDVLRTYPDGRMDILTAGRQRFELMEINEDRDFLRGEVELFDDDSEEAVTHVELAQMRSRALELNSELLLLADIEEPALDKDSEVLSFHLAASLPVDLDFKQSFLEMRSEHERMQTLLDYYSKIIPKLKMMAVGRKRAGGNGHVH
jgi:Lon protease-like protein